MEKSFRSGSLTSSSRLQTRSVGVARSPHTPPHSSCRRDHNKLALGPFAFSLSSTLLVVVVLKLSIRVCWNTVFHISIHKHHSIHIYPVGTKQKDTGGEKEEEKKKAQEMKPKKKTIKKPLKRERTPRLSTHDEIVHAHRRSQLEKGESHKNGIASTRDRRRALIAETQGNKNSYMGLNARKK